MELIRILTFSGKGALGGKGVPLTKEHASGRHFRFRDILSAGTRSLKRSGFRVRHRRAYEGRPQERAEGAQAKPPVSDEGELKREIN
jgi:hypothetical protein